MTQKNSISEDVKAAIVNYLSGQWEECDAKLLNIWLEADAGNSKLFSQLVDIWEFERMARNENSFSVDKAWNKLESRMDSGQNIPNLLLRNIARYAAIIILSVMIGAMGYYWTSTPPAFIQSTNQLVEYTAPYGSKTNLKLLDGSHVWLNAGTTIKYNQGFGTTNRDIDLTGEAFFEVAKNKNLPFVVNAKQLSVTALGTRFNVKAYPEEENVETILLEGSVRLQDEKAKHKTGTLLKPDEKAVFDAENGNLTVSELTDSHEVSWRREEWIIRNTPLLEFSKLLERRYNIDIEFNEKQIKNYQFGGVIKDETIEQVLTAITLSAPVKYEIVNNQVTLYLDESKIDQYKNLLK